MRGPKKKSSESYELRPISNPSLGLILDAHTRRSSGYHISARRIARHAFLFMYKIIINK